MVSTIFCKAKSALKKINLRSDFRPLPNKNVKMLDHFFPLLFPKDSESLKILDIRLWEVGGKKTVKRYLKSEHTDKHTDTRPDRQTDRPTNRLIESIGPEGRCFENINFMKLMFNTLVQPHIDYCWKLWMPQEGKRLDMMEKVMQDYTRRIPKLRGLSYHERLSMLMMNSQKRIPINASESQ